MLPYTHKRRSCALFSFFFVAVVFLLLSSRKIESVSSLSPASWAASTPSAAVAPLVGTANATLGFEAILAVSPKQTWRSVGLHAAAARTNLSIAVPPQRKPSEPEVQEFMSRSFASLLNEGSARAWLAHLQVLTAAQNYSSALIMEDDADWDVRIHEQAAAVAEAVRNLTVPATGVSESTWGEDWDVLWLGHCGERLPYDEEEEEDEQGEEEEKTNVSADSTIEETNTNVSRRDEPDEMTKPYDPYKDDYITLYDPTLPPTISSYDPRMSGDPEATRWVQHAAGPICTFAYAVTRASVAKMLAMKHGSEQAFDMWMHTRCRDHTLRCYSVNPEMFHHHIAAGLPASLVNEGVIGGKNYTENILYSARCNVDHPDDQLMSCMKE